MSMLWYERLAQARDRAGMRKSQMARAVGVSAPTVTDWESGRMKPRGDNLIKLCRVLKISERWLMDGSPESHSSAAGRLNRVPLISEVQAGHWRAVYENSSLDEATTWISTAANVGPRAFALEVVGDSMTAPAGVRPSIPEGAVVIVDPDTRVENGDIVVARLDTSDEATLKQYRVVDGCVYLKPLNPVYSTIKVGSDMCAVVVGVVKRYFFDM